MSHRLRHAIHLTLLLVVCLTALGQGQQAPPFRPELNDPLLRDLAYWWRAVPGQTDGTTFFDQTPSRADGTLTNMGYSSTSGWSSTDRPGGYAHLNFDGTNDYVATTATPAGLAPGTTVALTFRFTMCTWFWLGAAPGAGVELRIFSNQLSAAPNDGILLGVYNNTMIPQFMIITNSGSGFYAANADSQPLTLQQWTHLCGTYDGSANQSGMAFYINGQLAQQGTATAMSGSLVERVMAFGAINAATPGAYVNGRIDDAMLFRRTLDANEVQALYEWSRQGYTTPESGQQQVAVQQSEAPVGAIAPFIRDPLLGPSAALDPDLVGWWLAVQGLDDSTLWHDLSPSGEAGTLSNMGYGLGTGWASTDRAGGVAQMTFDGVDDAIIMATTTSYDLLNTTFSVSLWFRATTAGYLVAKRLAPGVGGGYFIRLNSDGTLAARVVDTGNTAAAERVTTSTAMLDGTWRPVVVVFTTDTSVATNNEVTIYVQGALDQGARVSTATLPTTTCACALAFGAVSDLLSGFVTGALDDVRIYSRGLSQPEIAQLVSQGTPSVANTALVQMVLPAGISGVPPGAFFPFFGR